VVPPNFTLKNAPLPTHDNAVTHYTASNTVEVYSGQIRPFRFAAPRLLRPSPDETLPPSVSLYARVEKTYSFFSQPLNMTVTKPFLKFYHKSFNMSSEK